MDIPSHTPNQVVAAKLQRARELLGWTQEQAAEHLEPFLGTRWSKASFSAAERSVKGQRIKQFSADEIVAFSLAFGFPVLWFFSWTSGGEAKLAGAREGVSRKDFEELQTTTGWERLGELFRQHEALVRERLHEMQREATAAQEITETTNKETEA